MAPPQAWDAGWTDNERVYPFDDSDDGSMHEQKHIHQQTSEEEEEEQEISFSISQSDAPKLKKLNKFITKTPEQIWFEPKYFELKSQKFLKDKSFIISWQA